MKKIFTQLLTPAWLVLAWLLSSPLTGAQSIPDAQWAKVGKSLAITTDGNIVTTELLVIPTQFPSLSIAGDRLVKYNLQGNKIWETGLLKGGFYIGGKIPGYDFEAIGPVQVTTAINNGGVAVAGRTSLRGASVPSRVGENGTTGSWADTDIFSSGSENTIDDIIGTPDGGFLILFTTNPSNAVSNATIRKYDAGGNFSWSKQLGYPTPNPASPDLSLTKGESVINTPDGGYLVAGYYNATGVIKDLTNNVSLSETGWVAKLDGQGNVLWQKLLNGLPISANINGPAPGSLSELSAATDVILAADGNGYALIGAGIIPSAMAVAPAVTAIVELNADGSFKRARSLGIPASRAFMTVYTGGGGKKYYAVGSTSRQNGADPQILLVNQASFPLTDPELLKVVAQRTFDGPSDGFLTGIGTAGDGSLVFATTASQLIKLIKEETPPTPPSGGTLALTQPTYNCATGAITFNTTGGDGSPITYSAPGISRSSATSNTGTVEQGLRNDPKPITITATQNGQTASYTFDFGAFCNGNPPNPPTPPTPPSGGTLALTQPTYNCQTGAITFNTTGGDGSPITYSAPGISRSSATSNTGTVEQGLRNDPKPITITATQNGQTASYTFDFGAFCSGTPPTPPTPPSGALILLAPTYNCATGAIHFNTSGGNGSPVEFEAIGITAWTTNPDQFVDKDSRTANDVQPFTLMARQNGVVVTYVWDLKAACGRARIGVQEKPAELSVLVLGNPVSDVLTVEVRGVQDQPLSLRLIDAGGRLMEHRRIEMAREVERQTFPLDQDRSGMLFLQVTGQSQTRTLKILKH